MCPEDWSVKDTRPDTLATVLSKLATTLQPSPFKGDGRSGAGVPEGCHCHPTGLVPSLPTECKIASIILEGPPWKRER